MWFNRMVFAYLFCLFSFSNAKCPRSVVSTLGYIIEHAVWRGWHQVVIYTTDLESDCNWAILRLVKCLGVNGIASAVDINEKARVQTNLGVVIFQRSVNTNTSNKFVTTVNQV
ncbi:unnamed protein product [Euphydryas editha]|uniref:Receptor ligand binding region domain-containing protein n=1 Tax=Euphydryas editha TaxID=104508 RepID=A0AAU9VA94_EUPED|nr:unnamed protein product [Euphydryas editha]